MPKEMSDVAWGHGEQSIAGKASDTALLAGIYFYLWYGP